MSSNKPILLVEDDIVDQMTVKRALKEIHVTNRLIIANNGEEALFYLQNDTYEKPTLVLLDINMPKMNGIEFLKVVKEDKVLKKIPVIVLSSSKEDSDRIDSFDLGVAGYMVKPVDYKKFVDVIRTIHIYWKLSEMPE
ncbi:MAG: response regulator [Acidobacteria bacterium]|nr:response regulator [Acidobacteriota bacterium]MCG2816643.1 response regulator [Candidatus Aminicenantes bacterium]MBU1339646.1 response regulator [Acidobacteriota bacterium]MBU1473279.1 response regulator [Acidobacteriota bacterium]MBU4203568.1 response regulator [Acidobacteriota bacterium]